MIHDNRGKIKGLVVPKVSVEGIVQISGKSPYAAVISKTKEEWDSDPSLLTVANTIYVYTDYRTVVDPDTGEEKNIQAIKIGDGTSYLIDMPFTTIGITQEDIDRWNAASTLQVSVDEDNEALIFTT